MSRCRQRQYAFRGSEGRNSRQWTWRKTNVLDGPRWDQRTKERPDPRGTLWYTPHSVGRPSENFKQDSELIRSALKTSFWMESVKWIGQKCTGHFWCRELMPRPQVAGWGSNTNDDGLTRVVATGWTEVPDIYFGQYLSVSVPLSHHNLRAMFSKFYYQNKRVFFFFKRRLLET